MKLITILGILLIFTPAIADSKYYQYKDISPAVARPFPVQEEEEVSEKTKSEKKREPSQERQEEKKSSEKAGDPEVLE